MGDLFEDYAAGPAWDEMFDPTGGIRPGYLSLHNALAALGVDDLAERGALRDRSLRDQGITFSLSGEERPIPLDLLPRVIAAEEWTQYDARRLIGRARTDLEFRPVDELLDDLPAVLREVQAAGSAASAAVAARFFGSTSPLVWSA